SSIRTLAVHLHVGLHPKRRRQLEHANRNPLARLDGLRTLSLRRTVRPPRSAPNQLLRLDGRDPAAYRVRVRGLARQFLYLQPTRAAGQLSHSAKTAQDRAAEAI